MAIAGLGPIVVAAALVSVRGQLVNVNVALMLVVVVVLAAVSGGRAAGALAAVMAALSYEFFFTKPYLSLRISDGEDAVTTVLLLVIGLVVGELVVIGRRNRQAAGQAQEGIARLHRVAELGASGARADDLIVAVEGELEALLDLDACTYEVAPFGAPLARLERNGAVASSVRHLVDGEFALPAEGVEIPVVGSGRQLGRLVLAPKLDVGISLERRVVAVALSDQLGAALAPAAEPVENGDPLP
jgi:Domain of unknown function (DUF4118)